VFGGARDVQAAQLDLGDTLGGPCRSSGTTFALATLILAALRVFILALTLAASFVIFTTIMAAFTIFAIMATATLTLAAVFVIFATIMAVFATLAAATFATASRTWAALITVGVVVGPS